MSEQKTFEPEVSPSRRRTRPESPPQASTFDRQRRARARRAEVMRHIAQPILRSRDRRLQTAESRAASPRKAPRRCRPSRAPASKGRSRLAGSCRVCVSNAPKPRARDARLLAPSSIRVARDFFPGGLPNNWHTPSGCQFRQPRRHHKPFRARPKVGSQSTTLRDGKTKRHVQSFESGSSSRPSAAHEQTHDAG